MRTPLLPALALTLCAGCGSALVRVPAPHGAAAPPRIERAIDLGSLPIAARGEVVEQHSDGLYTPGEWVALLGPGLAQAGQVSIGAVSVPVAGYLKGGLLVRWPRGLPPGPQTLAVGGASISLPSALYLFGADVRGDALRFRRLGPEPDRFADLEHEIKLEKARYHALSPDGGVLYAIQEPNLDTALVPEKINTLLKVVKKVRGGPRTCELLVVHLGAGKRPEKVSSIPLTLSSKPTGLVMGPQGQLVILQKRQLTVLDTSDPVQPREAAVLPLAPAEQEAELAEAAFLGDGRFLAVLEAYANQVHLVEMAGTQPRLASSVSLARAAPEPFSIDLTLGPDGRSLWVLQGPNLRLAGKRLLDGLKGMWSDVKKLEMKAAARTVGSSVGGAAMLPRESICRLVQLSLENGTLSLQKAIPLPDELFPFFVRADRDGSLYVSAIHRSSDFSGVAPSMEGLRTLLQTLKSTAQIGTVLKVSTEDGKLAPVLKGMAIYYDMAVLPGGKLLTSTFRLGPGFVPPRLTLDWGLELAGGPFSKLREVANSGFGLTEALEKLMPPYAYERIGTQ